MLPCWFCPFISVIKIKREIYVSGASFLFPKRREKVSLTKQSHKCIKCKQWQSTTSYIPFQLTSCPTLRAHSQHQPSKYLGVYVRSISRLKMMTYIPDTLSKLRILFSPWRLRTISSNTGTDPPTNPVFPPWGTTANLMKLSIAYGFYISLLSYLSWLQYFIISDTCCVVFGFKTNCDFPRNLCIQSVLKAKRSSSLL